MSKRDELLMPLISYIKELEAKVKELENIISSHEKLKQSITVIETIPANTRLRDLKIRNNYINVMIDIYVNNCKNPINNPTLLDFAENFNKPDDYYKYRNCGRKTRDEIDRVLYLSGLS